MDIQLYELINDEIERINPVLEKLGKGAKVIAGLAQEGSKLFERKKEKTEHPENIPERDSTITYITTMMCKCLDMVANGYALIELAEIDYLSEACKADPENSRLDSLRETYRAGLEKIHDKI